MHTVNRVTTITATYYAAGSNRAGYMPDSEPVFTAHPVDSLEALAAELTYTAEELDCGPEPEPRYAAELLELAEEVKAAQTTGAGISLTDSRGVEWWSAQVVRAHRFYYSSEDTRAELEDRAAELLEGMDSDAANVVTAAMALPNGYGNTAGAHTQPVYTLEELEQV